MNISFSTLNRIVEKHLAENPDALAKFRRQGRSVLSEARALSDEQLLDKLRSLNIPMSRDEIEQLAARCLSAQEMAKVVVDANELELGAQEDWVWFVFTCLWERWWPERLSLEMIDDKMQLGYDVLDQGRGDVQQACRLWLEAWRGILRIMEEQQLHSFAEFDALFGGTQSLFNWIQDFEAELHNAGTGDPQFLRERIALCQTILERFPQESALLIRNCKRALANSHFELGEQQTGERLYQQWLQEDPRWGWIGWADNYYLYRREQKDPATAERLLQQGLEVPDVENRDHIWDRLALLYEETGRPKEAEAARREAQALQKAKRPATPMKMPAGGATKKTGRAQAALPGGNFADLTQSLPGHSPSAKARAATAKQPARRVGRNEPCPCGSGKKFKKCCGRS